VKSDSRRVLILEPSGNLWGSERVLLDFLRAASTSAWQIGVCCPPNTPILEPLGALSVEVSPTFRANLHLQSRAQRMRATWNLLRTARHFRPALIYVNQAGATRIALAVGRILRVPVMTHVRLLEDVAYVASLRASAQTLPKVLCISHTIRRAFDKQSIVTPAQLEMIYDPYTMQSQSEASSFIFPFEGEAKVFSCVGRLAYIKGQDILLDALAVLRSEKIVAHALFVGEAGPDDGFGEELKCLSNKLSMGNQVYWAGFQAQATAHLARCVAQICPSRGEPLGRVVFEAWDAGTLPVAWAGSGGPAEVIEQSGGGLLFDEPNGDSLAQTLQEVLSMSREEKTNRIEAGRTWLRQNCDPATYASQMLQWLREVISTA
jgi:glycosyltransferase involved in cell wall biosynthesis